TRECAREIPPGTGHPRLDRDGDRRDQRHAAANRTADAAAGCGHAGGAGRRHGGRPAAARRGGRETSRPADQQGADIRPGRAGERVVGPPLGDVSADWSVVGRVAVAETDEAGVKIVQDDHSAGDYNSGMMPPAEHRLPPELRGVLDDLRTRIRRYVVIEGVSLVVVVLCGLFWISYLTDWAYFRLARLELPGWFRSGFFVVMLCCLAAGIVTWIVARLLRRLRSRALALVLEKRFPQLDDRLITAVELMENGDADTPGLTSAMQRQTLRDAALSIRTLDLGVVFDRRPLNRALFAAVLLAVSVAG